MAVTSAAAAPADEVRSILNVARLLITGGATAAVVFVLCWIGTFLPYSGPARAFISLFTNADVNSGRALAEGFSWSFLFGALATGLFGLIYNATAALSRR